MSINAPLNCYLIQVQILREAETEFWEAVTEYGQIELGLGLRFKDEVQSHIKAIRQHPTLPRIHENNYRRVNLLMFPFYLAYLIRAETIYVIAIANAKRKPRYWKEPEV